MSALQRLVVPVDEIGLESVERLDGDLDADLLSVLLALLNAVDRPFPLLLDRAHRRRLAHRGGDQRDDLPAQLRSKCEAVFRVLDRAKADVVVLVDQVTAVDHERHRAPALEVVLREQLLDLARVVCRRLTRDLDAVVAEARQPGQGRLDRFRPHPVVHREFQSHLTLHSNVQFFMVRARAFPDSSNRLDPAPP